MEGLKRRNIACQAKESESLTSFFIISVGLQLTVAVESTDLESRIGVGLKTFPTEYPDEQKNRHTRVMLRDTR
jgi:hypothetical protein